MKKNNISKFKKINKEQINNSVDINELEIDDIDLEFADIDIEDIEKDIEYFYIDKEFLNSIEVPSDLNLISDKAIDKAKSDERKSKRKKKYIAAAIILGMTTSMVGIYNPALAHKIPGVYQIFQAINMMLGIDGLSSKTGVDKVIPKLEVNNEGKIQVKKKVIVKEESVKVPTNAYEATNLIHEMSNSIIIAYPIWGYTEITPKTIDMAIVGLQYLKEEDNQYLSRELENWKNGKFSNGADVHNYVWDILEGNIGKAEGIDKQAIKEITEKYFNK